MQIRPPQPPLDSLRPALRSSRRQPVVVASPSGSSGWRRAGRGASGRRVGPMSSRPLPPARVLQRPRHPHEPLAPPSSNRVDAFFVTSRYPGCHPIDGRAGPVTASGGPWTAVTHPAWHGPIHQRGRRATSARTVRTRSGRESWSGERMHVRGGSTGRCRRRRGSEAARRVGSVRSEEPHRDREPRIGTARRADPWHRRWYHVEPEETVHCDHRASPV